MRSILFKKIVVVPFLLMQSVMLMAQETSVHDEDEEKRACWECLGWAWSDARLKHLDKTYLPSPDVLKAITPYSFVWKDSQRSSIGFIAQNLEAADSRLVIPGIPGEACDQLGDIGCKQIDLIGVVAVLTAEVKALRADIEALKADKE